jgi:mono/diheme cytochrome c family protein
MRATKIKSRLKIVSGIVSLAVAWSLGSLPLSGESVPGAPPLSPLVWDSMAKESYPAMGQPTADFTFSVTNTSDSEVVINNVQTSCGCTVAKTPPRPWHLVGHTNDSMTISVNLAGKALTFTKAITVFAADQPNQVLTVTVHMPDSMEAKRQQNMMLATTDRQGVFKNDCATCHKTPTEGKMGQELFAAACEICHDPKGPGESRAGMVPDLHALKHPTDYAYWKMIITIGKPGTLMPAFGSVAGGPLTDEQVDSLAKTLATIIPSPAQTNALNTLQSK